MKATLRQLRVFEATARLGLLGRAAEEQAISQSAASQAIRELEDTLQYPLFQRVGRNLVLTERGTEALPKVTQILRWVEDLSTPSGEAVQGALCVAASETIASYQLPRLLASFIQRYPQVVPDVKIANTHDVITAIEQSKAHVGLIEGPASHRQLQVLPWRADRLEVFCHPTHPLAHSAQLSLAQLADQRWILREAGSGTRAVFDAAVQKAGLEASIAMVLSRQEAIKQSVMVGLGVGCLSRCLIADAVALGQLKVLQTPLDLTRQLSIVAQPNEQHSATVTAFLSFLQDAEGCGV